MAKRTCEICGRPTDEADFSKSYKRRCKECVAREAREARAAKAENDITIPGTVLDSQPDWEQRRYDLGVTIFLNQLALCTPPTIAARQAQEAADQFIDQMRDTQL